MRDEMMRTLVDLRARQLAGEHMPCPRCGKDSMNRSVLRNALSRHADIFVCDSCGGQEAMLDFMQNPLPLDQWACFLPERPQPDFKDISGAEAWERIEKEQLSFLVGLYRRWLEDPSRDDFGAYRAEAHRHCAGLTHLWREPYQAAYDVSDGRLLLRFRISTNGVEVAHDLIGK
jgi:predicted RNA-binding Zn-ribbon protein involved in translation (DUF1610 family)